MQPPLPLRHARIAGLGRADFVVSPGNAMALALLEGWRDWPDRKFVLTGPSGSGKTHLTHIWAEAAGARIVSARELDKDAVPALATGPVAVEDVDAIDRPETEAALFHLHNLTRAEGQPLLLTGAGPVKTWPLRLPDLISRLQGASSATLSLPDDALMSALLVKLFADRQLHVPDQVIQYLLKRMDRSFTSAQSVVTAIDTASLQQRRTISLPFVRGLDLDLGEAEES